MERGSVPGPRTGHLPVVGQCFRRRLVLRPRLVRLFVHSGKPRDKINNKKITVNTELSGKPPIRIVIPGIAARRCRIAPLWSKQVIFSPARSATASTCVTGQGRVAFG